MQLPLWRQRNFCQMHALPTHTHTALCQQPTANRLAQTVRPPPRHTRVYWLGFRVHVSIIPNYISGEVIVY